jgi:hypothetical protein
MDVYTEHENFAILRVLFHYESILLSSSSPHPATGRLFRLDIFCRLVLPISSTSHAFDWLVHQTYDLASTAKRVCDADENQGSGLQNVFINSMVLHFNKKIRRFSK